MAAHRAGVALPIGDDAARGFDHGDGALDVIGQKPRFNHKINLPSSDQAISVAIGAVTGKSRLGLHTVKGSTDFGCAHFRKCGEQNRL